MKDGADGSQAFPNAMIMEADYGGQTFLACPERLVLATAENLQQLLCDLDNITWGSGFNPEHHEPESSARIYSWPLSFLAKISGQTSDDASLGLWLHPELENLLLRQQIEAILSGKQSRLALPPKFPDLKLSTLEEVRRYPRGSISFLSDRPMVLLQAASSAVGVSEEQILWQLLADLDQLIWRAPSAPFNMAACRLVYRPKYRPMARDAPDVEIADAFERRGLRAQIEAVLAGRQARIVHSQP